MQDYLRSHVNVHYLSTFVKLLRWLAASAGGAAGRSARKALAHRVCRRLRRRVRPLGIRRRLLRLRGAHGHLTGRATPRVHGRMHRGVGSRK